MCTLEKLRTRRNSFTPMEHRKVKRVMPYKQIQFNSDCICRLAERRGIHIDEAFELLIQRDGISFLNKLYAAKTTIRMAVNKLDKYINGLP